MRKIRVNNSFYLWYLHSLRNDRCRYSVNVLWKFVMKNQYKLSCNSSVFEIACIQETRSKIHVEGGSCVEIVNGRLRD